MLIDLTKFAHSTINSTRSTISERRPALRPRLTTKARVQAAISRGAPFLPLVYRQNFYEPLKAGLPDLMNRLQQAGTERQANPRPKCR